MHDYVFEALGRLSARACRIAEEVLVLLKAGYGQGALARWRALHEVAIVADVIAEYGDECAERYFAHEGVESWRAMQEYQEHAAALGQEPYSDEEVESARQQYEALLERYGRSFAGPYGWAQEAVAAKDARYARRDVTFSALEASVGTPHMRPYYRMASHGVHANPKGVTWTPDLLPTDRALVLLTGPSPAGLADPGHSTLASLTRVTATRLASKRGEATGLLVMVLRGAAGFPAGWKPAAVRRVESASARAPVRGMVFSFVECWKGFQTGGPGRLRRLRLRLARATFERPPRVRQVRATSRRRSRAHGSSGSTTSPTIK